MNEKNVSPDTRLLTTEDVAARYGVSEYTITQKWIPNGLKYFPFRPFRFKLEWVEDYIEKQAEEKRKQRQSNICEIVKNHKIRRMPKFNNEMKISLEDILEG